MKVLLVEDETLVRRFMKTLIDWEANGFTIVGEASNGEEAWQFLVQQPVDIVLTDIRMPVLNGFELIERICEHEIPCEVVILSSYDDFEYVRTALKLHVSDYVHKATISASELIGCLTKARDGWVKRQEQIIVDRMSRLQNGSRKCLVAANILREALEPSPDPLYLSLLSEQLHLWNEPFEVALACSSAADFKLESDTEDTIVFPYEEEWIVAGNQVKRLLQAQNGGIISIVGDQRIQLNEWPSAYALLKKRLHERMQEQELTSSFHASIQKAIEYLQDHYMQEITLERMSELVHVSPAYFSRLFMKETGRTFIDYLTALRLSHAKTLLLQTTLPVYQVADQVGYRNTRYFLKLFKESYGFTPTEFRAQQS